MTQPPPYGPPQPPQPGWGPPPGQPYPGGPIPPQQPKRPVGLIVLGGCGGLVALVVVFFVVIALLVDGDSSSDKPRATPTSSAPAKAGAPSSEAPAPAEEPEADASPVKVTAVKTTFAPSILHDGKPHTSVKVTVTNGSTETISINPLYFTVTDTTGEKLKATLGMDENQISTVKLAPGEKATGAITVKGKVTPATVTYTDGLFGDPIRASVK
ncbi:MAG TPA: DUF4352 domain-containing protein [Nocardioidaceae bacterium]